MNTPTSKQIQAFENAYRFFNDQLFNSELPPVILNLSRKNNAMGFAAAYRWRDSDTEPGKGRIHEISINPGILTMTPVDVYSTLVHEQCHVWQFQYGKPSRNGYHNKEWARKMVSVGLIPSDTGLPGGKMTGQSMSDYPKERGLFLAALEKMPDVYKFPFVSVESDFYVTIVDPISNTVKQVKKLKKNISSKNKYTCSCGVNIWGKPKLHIYCGYCGGLFKMANTIRTGFYTN